MVKCTFDKSNISVQFTEELQTNTLFKQDRLP
jgi:hypothetical protein